MKLTRLLEEGISLVRVMKETLEISIFASLTWADGKLGFGKNE
jgi:hypothetical protein